MLVRGVIDGAETGQECCSSLTKGKYWRDHGVDDSRDYRPPGIPNPYEAVTNSGARKVQSRPI